MFVHQMVGSGISCQFLSPTLMPADGDFFEFTFGAEPGICRYHCQIHGTMMSGHVGGRPGGRPMQSRRLRAEQHVHPAGRDVAPGGTVKWTNNETEAGHDHIVFADGGGAATYCLNGRAFVGNTPTIVGDAGERLRWYLFNLDLGGTWHNFHPHSSRWRLPTPPGGAADVHSAQPGRVLRRRDGVAAGRPACRASSRSCSATRPTTPAACGVKGDFLFHCHIEEHMMAGLAGLVRSRDYAWLTRDLPSALQPRAAARRRLRTRARWSTSTAAAAKRRTAAGRRRDQAMAGMPMPWPGRRGAGSRSQPRRRARRLRAAAVRLAGPRRACRAHAHRQGALLRRLGQRRALHDRALRSVVWDYEDGRLPQARTRPIDVFCAHQSFLADGRLLVVGGTETYAFTGLRTTYAFDPGSEEWVRLGDMSDRALVSGVGRARGRPRARRGRDRRPAAPGRDLLAADRLGAADPPHRTIGAPSPT